MRILRDLGEDGGVGQEVDILRRVCKLRRGLGRRGIGVRMEALRQLGLIGHWRGCSAW